MSNIKCQECGSSDLGLNVTTGVYNCHKCNAFLNSKGVKDTSGISAMLYDGYG